MTNATVDTTVGSVDGQVLMLKYKDGEKKIIVPPEAIIQRNVAGQRERPEAGRRRHDQRRDPEAGRHVRNGARQRRPRRLRAAISHGGCRAA